MKQQYRTMILCPLFESIETDSTLFQQYDDAVLTELFRTDQPNPPEDVAIGCSGAAKIMSCDFAIVNPPEIYRDALERALCDAGIVPVYPVYGLASGGHVVALGYRNADTMPDPASTPQLADRYRRWLETHYESLSEDDLVYCPDPWRTFVRFATKGTFKHRVH